MGRSVLLYDEDCGFCRWSARQGRPLGREGRRAAPGRSKAKRAGRCSRTFPRPPASIPGTWPCREAASDRAARRSLRSRDGFPAALLSRRSPRPSPGRPIASTGSWPAIARGWEEWSVRRPAPSTPRGVGASREVDTPREPGPQTVDEALAALREVADPSRLPGMAHVGITCAHALGVSLPNQRALARRIGTNHRLALALWRSGVHEGRMLASMVDDPAAVTETQMERWVRDFDSWDICDQVCDNLFSRTPFARERAFAWAERDEEFVRRAGFALMAVMAVRRATSPTATSPRSCR